MLDMLLTFGNSVEFTLRSYYMSMTYLNCQNYGQIRNCRMCVIWLPVSQTGTMSPTLLMTVQVHNLLQADCHGVVPVNTARKQVRL